MHGVRIATAALGVAALLVTATACQHDEGPAQKAGEHLDHARDKVADTVNPKGPAEKAGRAVDRAVGDHD